jgi:hypothetical protein
MKKKKILKIPMSDNTICQCIHDMSQDIETEVIADIKEVNYFAIQLDETTDITDKVQFLVFSRFVGNGYITEQFLFCKPLPETKYANTFLMLLTVISVSMICHGNHASAQTVLSVGKPERIHHTGQAKEPQWNMSQDSFYK